MPHTEHTNSEYDTLPDITAGNLPQRSCLIGIPSRVSMPCGQLLYLAAIAGYKKGYYGTDARRLPHDDADSFPGDMAREIDRVIDLNGRRAAYKLLSERVPDIRLWHSGSFSHPDDNYGLSLQHVLGYLFKGGETNKVRPDPVLTGILLYEIVIDDEAWRNGQIRFTTVLGSGNVILADPARYEHAVTLKPRLSQATPAAVLAEISKGEQLQYEEVLRLLRE